MKKINILLLLSVLFGIIGIGMLFILANIALTPAHGYPNSFLITTVFLIMGICGIVYYSYTIGHSVGKGD